MLKRIVILIFILSAMVLLAMVPMNVAASSDTTHKFQTTEEPPVVGVTIVVGATDAPATAPANGNGLPLSTLIIFGLIAVIGIGIVLGGMALMSRRQ
jgi:hypothetical protein